MLLQKAVEAILVVTQAVVEDAIASSNTLSICASKTLRNRIERCFNRLKNNRRVATRYDQHDSSFLIGVGAQMDFGPRSRPAPPP